MTGRVLAIDYGEKRIGLAISDPLRIIASPFKTLTVSGRKQALRELTEIIRAEEISEIIIGMPIDLQGKETEKTVKVTKFIGLLKQAGIPIHPVDERFSTVTAKRMLIESEEKKKRRGKEKLDALAAVVILRQFLESHK